MNDTILFGLNALKGVKQFGEEHPLVPANAVATAAFTGVSTAITLIEALDANRLNGSSTSRGASEEKQLLRNLLRSQVSDLSRISKTLDKAAHPDVASQLKIGHPSSYAALITLANNAVAVVTPIKQVFIDRGAPATVVEDLQASIDALQAATDRRLGGRGKRIGSNADLQAALRAGRVHVAVLDGIMRIAHRNSPGLLAEWKAAKRLQRRHPAQSTEQPAPGSGSNQPAGS
jgi:hypothetical protein